MTKAEIVVRTITEDLTPDEVEKEAIEEAKSRDHFYGFGKFHGSNKMRHPKFIKEPSYGKGKTLHANTDSPEWQAYQRGEISFADLRSGVKAPVIEEGKPLPEKPQWMKDLESGKRKQRAVKEVVKPRPILLY